MAGKIDFNALYASMIDLTAKEEVFDPSGSIILDAVISDGRGIPRGIFLELAGESGCGKSTMCLHIARRYCAQGKRVIYIDTESGLNGNQIDCFKMRDYVNEQLFVPVRLQTYGEVDEFLCKVLEDKDETELMEMLFDQEIAVDVDKYVEENATWKDRLADRITKRAGSWGFIIGFIIFLLLWMVINGVILCDGKAFDEYPFILLNLFLSCVAALQAPIIMMSQNRAAEKDSLRGKNDYKTDLKSELILEELHEQMTKMISNQNKIIKLLSDEDKM